MHTIHSQHTPFRVFYRQQFHVPVLVCFHGQGIGIPSTWSVSIIYSYIWQIFFIPYYVGYSWHLNLYNGTCAGFQLALPEPFQLVDWGIYKTFIPVIWFGRFLRPRFRSRISDHHRCLWYSGRFEELIDVSWFGSSSLTAAVLCGDCDCGYRAGSCYFLCSFWPGFVQMLERRCGLHFREGFKFWLCRGYKKTREKFRKRYPTIILLPRWMTESAIS